MAGTGKKYKPLFVKQERVAMLADDDLLKVLGGKKGRLESYMGIDNSVAFRAFQVGYFAEGLARRIHAGTNGRAKLLPYHEVRAICLERGHPPLPKIYTKQTKIKAKDRANDKQ